MMLQDGRWPFRITILIVVLFGILNFAQASKGDRLPEFKTCVETCKDVNCKDGDSILSLHLRMLFWNCASECDYTCQHIVTNNRLLLEPPVPDPIVQYHGKWPFYRIFGIQEPFSVLFSIFNFLAHWYGQELILQNIPASYPLRKYYRLFGFFGYAAWTFSAIFHTRDFAITEKADYFAAGAYLLYGAYYTPIRIFRLDTTKNAGFLRLWTFFCIAVYIAHVSYLTLWRWDYTYNMAFGVTLGIIQNTLWSWFSISRYRKLKRMWAAWPGLIVAWIIMAMSLELLDFAPILGYIDAHSLWHLGTVWPTWWWYQFLIRDAKEDVEGQRLKA